MRIAWLLLLVACDKGARQEPTPAPKPAPVPAVPIDAALASPDAATTRPCYRQVEGRRDVDEPVGPAIAARALDFHCAGAPEPPRTSRVDSETSAMTIAPSAAFFPSAFHCPSPKDVDFAKEQVAILAIGHSSRAHYAFDHAVEANGAITAIIRTTGNCEGRAPVREQTLIAFAFPKSDAPITLYYCPDPNQRPCTGLEH